MAATGELDSGNTTAASILTKSKRKCFFCGGPYVVGHRNSCPAVDAVCNNCHKEGHFTKVCQSKQRDKNVGGAAALFMPILSTIFEEASPPISAVLQVGNGENLTALLDSCSSDSFINEKTAEHLDLKINPATKKISMAQTTPELKVLGNCVVDIILNGNVYSGVYLAVLKNL